MSVDQRETRVVVTQRQIKQVVSTGTQGPKGGLWLDWDDIPGKPDFPALYDPLGAADDAEAAAAADASAKDAAHVAAPDPHPQYATDSALSDHTGNTANPHSVTKAQVGLGNVDNTSDANKPVSTAQQAALNGKEATIAAGTTSQYWRGDKSWRDFATDVRASVLTGLSTASATVVAAADSVLVSIGKLQAQISDVVTQADAEAGTSTTRKSWTAQRVRQAAAAWWLTASSALGRTLANVADAAAGRAALGLGSASTLTAGQADANLPTNTDIRAYYGTKFKAPIRPSLRIDWENGVFERYVASTNTWKRFDNWSAFAADLGADITITRTGEQAYFDALGVMRGAAANTIQCDHDPLTGVPLGPYIGGARTNECWPSSGGSIGNTTISATATLGLLTLTEYTENTASSGRGYTYNATNFWAVDTAKTVSVYAREKTGSAKRYVLIRTGNSPLGGAIFDVGNGTIPLISSGWTASITHIGGGVYRCTATHTRPSANGVSQLTLGITPNILVSSASYTGDGVSGLWLGGIQGEAGANASPLIPTTGAAATRPATDAYINGTALTEFLNPAEGVLVSAGRFGDPGATSDLICLRGADIGDSIRHLSWTSGGSQTHVLVGGTAVATLPGPTLIAGTRYQFASSYALNAFAGSVNGANVATDSSGAVPTPMTSFVLGGRTGSEYLNGHLAAVACYPHQMTTTQITEMSK